MDHRKEDFKIIISADDKTFAMVLGPPIETGEESSRFCGNCTFSEDSSSPLGERGEYAYVRKLQYRRTGGKKGLGVDCEIQKKPKSSDTISVKAGGRKKKECHRRYSDARKWIRAETQQGCKRGNDSSEACCLERFLSSIRISDCFKDINNSREARIGRKGFEKLLENVREVFRFATTIISLKINEKKPTVDIDV